MRVVLLAGLGLLACAGSPRRDPGTARMADSLTAIYARALAAPQRNPFLNRVRAESLKAMLPRIPRGGNEALQLRYLTAQEQLLAGQTQEAIDGLEALMEETRVPMDQVAPETRRLFDLLAIGYLRLGEQQNCADNPAANVCILPFTGGALHAREEAARQAASLYEVILRRFPDDPGSRWLYNIARMALGGYPDSIPPRFRIPGLAPSARDPAFPRFANVAGRLGLEVNGLAGGLSVDDFNGDGWLDLFMTSWGPGDPVHLFLADGRGGYYDHTPEAGLAGITGGLNTVHADYDNDGDVDVLILRGAWLGDAGAYPNSLLRNRGDGRFDDVTFAAGLASYHPRHSAAWGDFNLDGRLDLFVGNESMLQHGGGSHRSELYLNTGDGGFREVAAQVGIVVDELVKGAVWGDVNNDGLPDLFLSVLGGPNRLFLNRGGASLENWRFEERGVAAGVAFPIYSFPTWFWDVDQDGWEDLLVLGYDLRHGTGVHEAVAREQLGLPLELPFNGRSVPVELSRLYRNQGDGTFADLTAAAGLRKVVYAMGSNFGDLDNDGWLDFYVGTGNPDLRSIVPNRMFRGLGGFRFEEVTLPGGFGHIQKGHAPAFADFDRDGDQDIYMVMGGAYEGDRFSSVLFENPGWPGRSWIGLTLEGRSANRSAIGARVELVIAEPGGGTRTLHRTVGTGGSFGAGPLALHIGVGPAIRVERLTIRWPDSARSMSSHQGLALNRAYRIVQGRDPVELARPAAPFRKAPADSHHAARR